ncbi:MAG: preprotein translocase subunit SecE [Candidatus Omnitrophica bacterium]|nr:preprotein translocase subunit SecE [Candidatus Omnitrophota bacterium]
MPKIKEFFREVRVEFRKVSWPTRKVLQKFTILVLLVVILLSVFTGTLDTIFSKFISIFFK